MAGRAARLTALLAALAAVALPASAQGQGPRPPARVPAGLDETQASANVILHYTTTGEARDRYTDPARAAAVLERFELARTTMLGLGYPAPADDGDGKIDVYVFDCDRVVNGPRSYAGHDPRPALTGWICLTPADASSKSLTAVSHELFHLVHFAMGDHAGGWATEAFATWAERQVAPLRVVVAQLVPLDCPFSGGLPVCDNDQGGYLRWSYFAHLADRHGQPFLRTIAGRLFRTPPPTDPLGEIEIALASLGVPLRDSIWTYAGAIAAGDAKSENLQAGPANRTQAFLPETGAAVALPPAVVDHLSASYGQVTVGGPEGDPSCTPGRLAVAVTVPSGVTDIVPVGVLPSRGPATQLRVGPDGVARGSVPLTTCERGIVAFPNGSRDVDAATFTTQASWKRVIAAPVLSQVALNTARIRPAARGATFGGAKSRGRGATLRFRSSNAGTLRLRVYRRSGEKRGGLVLSATRSLRAGPSALTFTGRASVGRPLARGTYRLELRGSSRTGEVAPVVVRRFSIVR